MTTKTTKRSRAFVGVFLLIAYSLSLQAAAPTGWFLAGSRPASYDTGIDGQIAYNGHPSAYLKSNQQVSYGFGTLMQEFRAEKYAGKRLRLSAFIKPDQVQDWAGLWMRVDKDSQSVAFDNMEDRPIKGTNGWHSYQVVLDVPQDASVIAFGVLLSGTGTVWLNSVELQVVGTDVPKTGKVGSSMPDQPMNLNFENP